MVKKTECELLLQEASRLGTEYLRTVRDRRVAPEQVALDGLNLFDCPLSETGLDGSAVLRELDQWGSPATVASAGGRYFGLVIGGALPVTVAANWLATAWDQNAVFRWTSPIAAKLEDVSLSWLANLFGIPQGYGGAFVSGASMANMAALASARHALLSRVEWNVEEQGLAGSPSLRIVVSEEAHVTVLKALALLGLGSKAPIKVPVDEQGRMRPEAMPTLDEKTIVCIQAGNVNTGAFDPARDICALARKAGAWVHVDGAFGLWARAAKTFQELTNGFELADSWATDAHKWLNVPYDNGVVLVREARHLRASMSANAAYLLEGIDGDREPSHYTLELSRRARGIDVWAALRHLGRSGVAAMIERCCRHARCFADGLRNRGFVVLNKVVLNQVLVSFGPPELTRLAVRILQSEGICWCGSTVWQGQTAMRISVSSWATTEADVELSLEAINNAVRMANDQISRGTDEQSNRRDEPEL